MIINIQQFLEELISDMNVSYPSVNKTTENNLSSLILHFTSLKESPSPMNKQGLLINQILISAFYAMELEIHKNETVNDFCAATRLKHNLPYYRYKSSYFYMIEQLSDFEYRSQFFNLFKLKGSFTNEFIFPKISKSPEKMQKLACLLDFCAAYPDALESAEIDTDKLQFDKKKSLWNLYYQPVPEPKSVTASLLKPIDTNMMILGGFIAVLGIAAVAIALTLLSASAFGFGLAVLGVVGIAGGAGIGIYGLFANRPPMPDGSSDDLYEKLTNNYSAFPVLPFP